MGILTDHTNPATMGERSNKKRSSEEIKVTKLIKLFKDKGLPPPTPFGIPEDDLLFALPPDAIRQYLKGQRTVRLCRPEVVRLRALRTANHNNSRSKTHRPHSRPQKHPTAINPQSDRRGSQLGHVIRRRRHTLRGPVRQPVRQPAKHGPAIRECSTMSLSV